jgi:DNA polymerase III delta subunit
LHTAQAGSVVPAFPEIVRKIGTIVIAIVLGPDASLAKRHADRLAAAHDPGGENTTRIDGREASVAQIAAAAGSAGFFGRRAVVVDGLLAKSARSGDDAEADRPTRGKPTLDVAALVAAVAPDNLLILLEPTLASVPAAVKKALPADAEVIASEPPRGAALLAAIAKMASDAGGGIDRAGAELLAESLFPQTWRAKPNNPRYDRPPDMERLRGEVEKLVLAAYPESVSARQVEAMTLDMPDDQLFAFIDAAAAGDLPRAVAGLDRLLAAGEEPAKLVAQLHGQVELAAVAALAGSRAPADIGRDLGLPNPQRMAGIARGRSDAAEAAGKLAAALANDRALKRGRLRQPDDAIFDLVARLAAASRTRRTGGR